MKEPVGRRKKGHLGIVTGFVSRKRSLESFHNSKWVRIVPWNRKWVMY
jgi:hypothetical protein